MKENKGFTLIELLAVIVILAIIALIATPMILGVIETAKKGASESSALGYIDAVEKQAAINELDSTKTKLSDGVYEISELKDTQYGITVKGDAPDSGWVVIENGTISNYSLVIGEYVVTKGSDTTKGETATTKPSGIGGESGNTNTLVCKRATELHTEQCLHNDTEIGCAAVYGIGSMGMPKTITYGTLEKETDKLTSGDAFDCDIDGDGVYGEKDATTGKYIDRFYYVSGLNGDSNSDTAVLIYYSNTTGGASDNTSSSLIQYNIESSEINGPLTLMKNLPTTTQWKISSPGKRNITNVAGTVTVNNFDYSAHAARLLTVNELLSACDISSMSYSKGSLDSCQYLFENTFFSSSEDRAYGYWLETHNTDTPYEVWGILGDDRTVYTANRDYSSLFGARPVIEVPVSRIEK